MTIDITVVDVVQATVELCEHSLLVLATELPRTPLCVRVHVLGCLCVRDHVLIVDVYHYLLSVMGIIFQQKLNT